MNVYRMGFYGIFFLLIMGIISNISSFSASGSGFDIDSGDCTTPVNIDTLFCKTVPQRHAIYNMNCPLPLYNGVQVANGTIFYNTGFGTYFKCILDDTAPHGFTTLDYRPYNYTLFGFIPQGWLQYTGDTLGIIGQRISGMLTIFAEFITPIGFNILGYTIGDLSGVAVFVLIATYSVVYIFIGLMVYKAITPMASVS